GEVRLNHLSDILSFRPLMLQASRKMASADFGLVFRYSASYSGGILSTDIVLQLLDRMLLRRYDPFDEIANRNDSSTFFAFHYGKMPDPVGDQMDYEINQIPHPQMLPALTYPEFSLNWNSPGRGVVRKVLPFFDEIQAGASV